ncbi:hypothetical protein O0L34_g10121 [Tuta absoluta]|nr:hypothetical protein O0L34_g10121 [Tuta absoluta]
MSKRKCEENVDFDYIRRKIKDLEKMLKKCKRDSRPRVVESEASSPPEPSPPPKKKKDGEPATFSDARDDSLADIVDGRSCRNSEPGTPKLATPPDGSCTSSPNAGSTPSTPAAVEVATTSTTVSAAMPPNVAVESNTSACSQPSPTDGNGQETSQSDDAALDTIILDILGDDPSTSVRYGNEIHKDLASRFVHLATHGLDKSIRKDLTAKYLIPSNCTQIGAPKLNVEIKAALPEGMVKRDKAIEVKQKLLSSAIACLAGAMTDQLNSKDKNHDLLKKLMDTGRLLCDLQHAESVTRRNFALYSVKKDMKEHLTNTKIDTSLFGENLAEALKTAKAVNKSSTDLKIPSKSNKKPASYQRKANPASAPEGKNWKPPVAARKPAGAATNRSRQPTSSRGQHATSYKRSSPPPKTTHHQ